MPGIAGILGRVPEETPSSEIRRIAKCMVHEPWHEVGTYHQERVNLRLAWVLDQLATVCAPPVWNEEKDTALFLIGECFFDGADEASSPKRLLELYAKDGKLRLEDVDGAFAGVLVDLESNKVVLFNDRYGLHRLYYHQTPHAIFFASEAKFILRALPSLRKLDYKGLGELCCCGCPLQGRTLFGDISLIPPASQWTFTWDGRLTKGSYLSPASLEALPVLRRKEFQSQLTEIFGRTIAKYVDSPRPMAMSLTGGLDGRMIMAWMRRTEGSLPCYTFGGPRKESLDVKIARKIALACGQPHQTIVLDDAFFDQFPALAAKAVHISDGTMGVSGAANVYLNRLARQIAPTRLTGNYGSELLRGNVAFKPRRAPSPLFEKSFQEHVMGAVETYEAEKTGHPLSFIAFKQVPWHHSSLFVVEQSELLVRSPFLDKELLRLMYQAPPDMATSTMPSLQLINEGNPNLGRIPTDRGLVYRPLPGLTKFRRVIEQCRVKAEYACDAGMPQWLARLEHSLPGQFSRLFLGRHKFYHARVAYKDFLSDYVQEVLLDPATLGRPYFQRSVLERMVSRHVRGIENHTDDIDRALSLELLQRQLIEPLTKGT